MSLDEREKIRAFLESGPFAVVGASTDRRKYGNKVLRCYLQHGKPVYAVNPRATEVEGLPSFASLGDLPERPRAVSVITPPEVTERVVEDAHAAGAGFVWMQPGAESATAVRRAEDFGLVVLAGGPCLLVALGFRDE